ncbi:MAG TPA: hypothetical protein VK608_05620 [Edaphobacter sp.]|nr:hypothetical protein [Edaphobacter sp.]
MGSAHEACQLAPFAEFDNSMVPKTHHIGDVGDRNQSVVWSASDLQQKLMLLWLQTRCGCGLLAKLQEAPNLITKFGQQLNLIAFGGLGQGFHLRSIVSRYDLK